MLKPRANRYIWLAEYYDQIFTPYLSWSKAAHKRVLHPVLPGVQSACDLACGTGTTALTLACKGIQMFAVDLSPRMCSLAREKARRASVPLHVLRADMRTFRLPEPVDLILCEYDALNHVPRKADLRLVANAVARALRPGGYFYFDVNNRQGFKRYWPSTVWIEKAGVAVVMHGGHDRLHDRAWSDLEWFVRDGNCWKRHHERVEEVCWSPPEIRRVLREAGFSQVRAWDATPFFKNNPLIRRGCRTVYLARKSMLP
jgi:SAM-dependent methyltransferase